MKKSGSKKTSAEATGGTGASFGSLVLVVTVVVIIIAMASQMNATTPDVTVDCTKAPPSRLKPLTVSSKLAAGADGDFTLSATAGDNLLEVVQEAVPNLPKALIYTVARGLFANMVSVLGDKDPALASEALTSQAERRKIRWFCNAVRDVLSSSKEVYSAHGSAGEDADAARFRELIAPPLAHLVRSAKGTCGAQLGHFQKQDALERSVCTGSTPALPSPLPAVPQLHAPTYQEYSQAVQGSRAGGTPVVIRGGDVEAGTGGWSTELINEKCGGRELVLLKPCHNKEACQPKTGLEPAETSTIANALGTCDADVYPCSVCRLLAGLLDKTEKQSDGPRSVWGWSVPQECPELLQDFLVPRYWAPDLLRCHARV